MEVLLVEDQREQAKFIERLISEQQMSPSDEAGHNPIYVTDIHHVDRLEDALKALETDSPDVILLDLMLPDSRGTETVKRVTEHAPDIPVVVLTSQNETEMGVDAIQRGAQEYLSKRDVTGEILLRTLKYAIERSRNQRAIVDRTHRFAVLNQIVRQDIRNDLSIIIGLGDQLRSDPHVDEQTVESLLDAAQHVVDLTDTAAAVIDAVSTEDFDREPRDLHTIVETEVTKLRREREVDITIERGDGTDGQVIVPASPMLGSVFEQLLTNAVAYSDQSTPQVTVTVETTPEEVTVEIADQGIGIPHTQKQALANPESRFDRQSGISVGLYLVTTVLDNMGGELSIEDNQPQGTIVTVSLERWVAETKQDR